MWVTLVDRSLAIFVLALSANEGRGGESKQPPPTHKLCCLEWTEVPGLRMFTVPPHALNREKRFFLPAKLVFGICINKF